ncbi:Hypothetical_protein [Hexamita inflata]|uniref:Hypothetical_protein n=1 Tax=Hexamita inflata TaxID=28002 RepID=A0AA86P7R2_9EUKA|nr:Hypothetical protein HINF_LOCUS19585 [Hexamita inflata]
MYAYYIEIFPLFYPTKPNEQKLQILLSSDTNEQKHCYQITILFVFELEYPTNNPEYLIYEVLKNKKLQQIRNAACTLVLTRQLTQPPNYWQLDDVVQRTENIWLLQVETPKITLIQLRLKVHPFALENKQDELFPTTQLVGAIETLVTTNVLDYTVIPKNVKVPQLLYLPFTEQFQIVRGPLMLLIKAKYPSKAEMLRLIARLFML